MSRAAGKPGTVWYFFAAVLALAGCIAGAAMVWHGVALMADVKQFLAPGSARIEVATPGDYLIWHDYRTVFQGRAYSVEKSLPDGVNFHVVGPDGTVTVSGAKGATTTMGETESAAVASFPAAVTGHYEIAIEGELPTRIFSVGPDNLAWSFALIFAGVLAILLALIAGMALGAWAYYQRNVVNEGKGVAAMSEMEADPGHAKKQLATLVYALQAASFLVGITFIAAIIVNYLRRDEVAGTWLESHFDWQIRTFWWSLLWGAIGLVLAIVAVGIFVLLADALWVLYRIIKGWLNLNDGKAMYE